MIANTVANTVAKLTNSVFVIAYLSGQVAYMSDLLIGLFVRGAILRDIGLSPIIVRNTGAIRVPGKAYKYRLLPTE